MLQRLRTSLRRHLPALTGAMPLGAGLPIPKSEERFRLSAAVPGRGSGVVCAFLVEVVRVAHQEGERIRVRAHVQANLASVVRPALQRAVGATQPSAASRPPNAGAARGETMPVLLGLPSRAGEGLGRGASMAAGRLVRGVWSNPWVQRVAEPLLRHDLNTWVDIHASTASLDAGASALLPGDDQFAPLGIRPAKMTQDGVQIDVWAHGNERGEAEISVLQLDKRDLPPELRRELGTKPFQLVATIARTAERK